jgi:hypothetical protein
MASGGVNDGAHLGNCRHVSANGKGTLAALVSSDLDRQGDVLPYQPAAVSDFEEHFQRRNYYAGAVPT